MSRLSSSVVPAVAAPLLLLPVPGGGAAGAGWSGVPPGQGVVAGASSAGAVRSPAAEGVGAGAAARGGVSVGGEAPAGGGVGASAGGDTPVGGGASRTRWSWPIMPVPRVLRPFRAPAGPYGPGHRGIDLAAAEGEEVLAVDGGVVTHAGRVAGRGTVTVMHPDGLSSTYEPVRPRVAAGTEVGRGDALGTVEAPGPERGGGHCVVTGCLHLGARRGGGYVDPLPLLRGERVRLLPLPSAQPTTG